MEMTYRSPGQLDEHFVRLERCSMDWNPVFDGELEGFGENREVDDPARAVWNCGVGASG
jgi:hypothetical protein